MNIGFILQKAVQGVERALEIRDMDIGSELMEAVQGVEIAL